MTSLTFYRPSSSDFLAHDLAAAIREDYDVADDAEVYYAETGLGDEVGILFVSPDGSAFGGFVADPVGFIADVKFAKENGIGAAFVRANAEGRSYCGGGLDEYSFEPGECVPNDGEIILATETSLY